MYEAQLQLNKNSLVPLQEYQRYRYHKTTCCKVERAWRRDIVPVVAPRKLRTKTLLQRGSKSVAQGW